MTNDQTNDQTNDAKRGRKTGIFYVKDPPGVVVMQDGKEMHRYKTIQEFVDAHVKGIAALERQMEEELAKHYRPD